MNRTPLSWSIIVALGGAAGLASFLASWSSVPGAGTIFVLLLALAAALLGSVAFWVTRRRQATGPLWARRTALAALALCLALPGFVLGTGLRTRRGWTDQDVAAQYANCMQQADEYGGPQALRPVCQCVTDALQRAFKNAREATAASASEGAAVATPCFDASPATYDFFLRAQQKSCVISGVDQTACACIAEQVRARWPKLSDYIRIAIQRDGQDAYRDITTTCVGRR